MIIRLRTKDGLKRIEADVNCNLLDLRTQIEREFKIPVTKQKLSAEVSSRLGYGCVPRP